MRSAALLLVTTLAVSTLGDGPGHHGHHGEHHGAHHGEHGAHHEAHPVANTQKHAPHHAAHAHPQPQPQPHPQKVQLPPRPLAPKRAQSQPVPRPVPVRLPRKPQPALRPRPAHPRPVVRKPFNPFAFGQQRRPLGQGPRLVRGLHNNLPDRAPRPGPHHQQHNLRRPNVNVLPNTPTKAPKAVPQLPAKTVAALIAENEHFSTLHTALKAAGMMERLAGQGPFTVFAPTNAAFDKVPVDSLNKLMANKEELVKVLERHIVPGVRMEGKEVPNGNTKLRSAAGDELSTDRDNFVKVTTPAGSAFIVKFDFLGKNGVYHAVDQVL